MKMPASVTNNRISRVLPPGLYEIEFTMAIPGFDREKLYYQWDGQKTGPWDYSWLKGNEGALLLPYVDLYVDGQKRSSMRVFIPRKDRLEQNLFRGAVGFRQEREACVSLELKASDSGAQWQEVRLRRLWDIAAHYRREDFHMDGQRFWLSDRVIKRLREHWTDSRWGKQLDHMIEGYKDLRPPRNLEERRDLKLKGVVNETDYVVFIGQYLGALSLRYLAQERSGDWEQLLRWFDALIALEVWGRDPDPDGRDHNNDLTAGFDMFGVTVVLNWFSDRLGAERLAKARKKIRYQVEQMLQWIISARVSWPSVFTQNHGYYGYQVVLLGALNLLEHEPEALEWANIAARGFQKFLAELPPDGTFQEGQGYGPFSMLGLLPCPALLEQLTGERWMPRPWITKHMDVCADLVPPGVRPGLSHGDGDNSPPAFAPMVAWQLHDTEVDPAARAGALRLMRRLNRYGYDFFCSDSPSYHFWLAVWGDSATDAPQAFGAEQTTAAGTKLHSDSGHVIIDLAAEAKAYFMAGPPNGHRIVRRERCPYAFGHHHPDAGNLLLNVAGNWVLADTGYTWAKRSCEHNVLIVNGEGQHNDGYVWTAEPPDELNPPEVHHEQHPDYAYAVLDLACYYPARKGLNSWVRRVYGVYDRGIVVVDDVLCDQPSELVLHWGSDKPWKQTANGYVTACGEGSEVVFQMFGGDTRVDLVTMRPCKPKPAMAKPWHALELRPVGPAMQWKCISCFALPGVRELPVCVGEELRWATWTAKA
jgi:hypothetical protein